MIMIMIMMIIIDARRDAALTLPSDLREGDGRPLKAGTSVSLSVSLSSSLS